LARRAAGPTPFEHMTTTVLLRVSSATTLWGTAKVFRIGIPMTGKSPRLLEVAGGSGGPSVRYPQARPLATTADTTDGALWHTERLLVAVPTVP
jgi:hypothetical protein